MPENRVGENTDVYIYICLFPVDFIDHATLGKVLMEWLANLNQFEVPYQLTSQQEVEH